MKISLFDFDLPADRIASHPASPRDASRLLAVHGDRFEDAAVADLSRFLRPGDVMVFNDTRVIPARLAGKRGEARVEVTLHKPIPSPLRGEGQGGGGADASPAPPSRGSYETSCWAAFARPAKRLKPGDRIAFAPDFSAEVMEKNAHGEVALRFDCAGDALMKKLAQHGQMPLPPYIRRPMPEACDAKDYQTIYAKSDGAVAAPTAGLHFTERLLAEMDARGVRRVSVTLHVGAGTFLPVKAEDTEHHKMHSEWGCITPEAAEAINTARKAGGRVVAVGTTSLRLLESAADAQGNICPFSGETAIFITPGYRFKTVDVLMTNFHLPRSTLFMLVCAFAGMEEMKTAYQHAISNGYRFYSYGDACLVFKSSFFPCAV